MFDFEDPWWAVAIALLLCLWIGETVIVVRAVQPLIGASGQYLDYAQETGEPQLPLPLSVMWPLAAVFFGYTAVGPGAGGAGLKGRGGDGQIGRLEGIEHDSISGAGRKRAISGVQQGRSR